MTGESTGHGEPVRRGRAPELRAGLCSIALRQEPVERIVALAVAARLVGIEWGADVHVPPGDVRLAERVAATCADAGVACPSYGSYLRAGESAAHDLEPVLDSAAALGVTNIRVWTATGVTPSSAAADRARVTDAVRAWATAVTARGFTISLEFHPGTLTETAASTVRLLDDADVPGLYTYWQPDWPLGTTALVEEYRAVAARNSHLHVFGPMRYPVVEELRAGAATWAAVLPEVAAATGWPHERFAFIEHVRDQRPEQVGADATTLHALVAAARAAVPA